MKFTVEAVEYYPDKNKKNIGSLHVYVEELDMDLRGIIVEHKKGSLFFHFPFKWGKNEKGEKCRYPIVSFIKPGKNKALMDAIRAEGTKFIRESMKNKEKK